MQTKPFLNFEREEICFQALHMRININFGPLCQDHAIMCEEIILVKWEFHSQKQDLMCEKHPT